MDDADYRRGIALEKCLESLLDNGTLDWDKIMPQIAKSTMIIPVISDEDFTGRTDNGIITAYNTFNVSGYSSLKNRPATVFASRQALKDVDIQMFKYSQAVNFKSSVDAVLAQDLKGRNIKSEIGEGFMSMDLLIEKYELIEKHCDDIKLKIATKCLFTIE